MTSADTTSLKLSEPQPSLDVLKEIDSACTSFERALQRGELGGISEMIAVATPAARPHLLHELLALEMEFRARNGESPDLAQFYERFPHDKPLVRYLYLEHFVPARMGEFAIQRLLGRGAYGHVYQGWDTKLARHVAIKSFRRDPTESKLRQGNLLAEARTVAQLRHPGIVTVYGIQADEDGQEFLLLEYIDGRSLEDLLRSDRFTPAESAQLLLAVVQALQHAHWQGVVHRDLKPANILLDSSRRPRVTDFGLAMHLTAIHRRPELAGTVAYMAPEQASGETHRVDARTDLWAVGVILYRMLSGSLPFTGSNPQEYLEAIRYAEPRDVREIAPQVPPELARIVRRCLAKRMSERYQSAAELIDDLTALVNPQKELSRADAGQHQSAIAVVPKGLRSFDATDREFFLSLVPGPRDRHGVPASIRFWQRHLQESDPSATFRVGLVYGPSGCGKSSLVRAGILPRLSTNVRHVFVEAARDETELSLMRELRRTFPQLSHDLTLAEAFRELREGSCLPAGDKLVVVFDQFEQWLHDWQQNAVAQLVEALRQCDGRRVQALILVRDDFWMPATRFFQQLDVPLVEGFNAGAVDLFDRAHATKVLAAFGVAYGRFDANQWQQNAEQSRFLDCAVDELAEDGWIVPVRLCIFAEMVKARPWSPATLREVGGAQGLGESFLEEVFEGRSASPMYRLHRKAARLVLERLLPPPGTDIRGHLVPEADLRSVSGYEQRPAEFAALLRCLDQELRLITPSEIEEGASAEQSIARTITTRHYQLTHDYLVSAIRGWLNHGRRRTVRGRAKLRLTDYANAYALRQETRQLPSWWEWLSIALLTQPQTWSTPESTMMRRATQHYALRVAAVIGAALCAVFIIYDRLAAVRAEGLVQTLATSESRDVPQAAEKLKEYRRWTLPRLASRLAAMQPDNNQEARLLLGLIAVGESRTEEVFERLFDTQPAIGVAIIDVLSHYGYLGQFEQRLWTVANDDFQSPGKRLRAWAALAQLTPSESAPRWAAAATTIDSLLLRTVTEDPGQFTLWVNALSPVREWLAAPLREMSINRDASASDRLLAANILAHYLEDQSHQLLEIALQSAPQQFEIFVRALQTGDEPTRAALLAEINRVLPPGASEEEQDRLARRQSNAILLLREWGQEQWLWPALKYLPHPRVRSYLIDAMRQASPLTTRFKSHLADADPGIRQASILILGSMPAPVTGSETHATLVDLLLHIYRNDPDAGVHSAAEWSLQRLGSREQVDVSKRQLAQFGVRSGFKWYVTKSLITMIIFDHPGLTYLGSPETEPGRDRSDEKAWSFDLNWSFAISSTEITQAQYHELVADYKQYLNEHAAHEDCPANAVNWLQAAQYCRLLSERDGLADGEMAIPAVEDSRKGNYPNPLERSGYRLPLEVEWEFACRAHTETPRFFGYAPDLLPQYACYIGNSGGHTWPVAHGLPNQFGMFDTLGNVSEWCYDKWVENPASRREQVTNVTGFAALANYAVRGNDHVSDAHMLRSANRRFALWSESAYSRGFRIAHTIRLRAED